MERRGVLSLCGPSLRISTWDVIFLTGLWTSSSSLWEFSLYGLMGMSTVLRELSCSLCVEFPETVQSSSSHWFWRVQLRAFVMGLTHPTWWHPLGWRTQILSETLTASHDNLWVSPMAFGGHGKQGTSYVRFSHILYPTLPPFCSDLGTGTCKWPWNVLILWVWGPEELALELPQTILVAW